MTHPDHALWKQGWRANHIPFHLDHVHPLLLRFWAMLGLDGTGPVFVPLCGKSLDIMWLHKLGHPVLGVELSPVAVRQLFKAAHRQATSHKHGALTCWSQDRLAIYCGDFFALTRQDLLGVRAVYDRAALTALPEELRQGYVAHLHAILPSHCAMMLITVEDLDDDEQEALCMDSSQEIMALYAGYFSIELLHAEYHPAYIDDSGEPGRSIHKVYRLKHSGMA